MTPPTRTSVLIVEDERIIAKALDKRLRAMGYEVAGSTASGEDAVRLALDMWPDVILMDIHLGGGIDGIEAADRIRREQGPPVLFLTAHSDPATLERAKITGPHGYVLKPYHDRDIQTAIEVGLYRHKTEGQLAEYRRELEQANAQLKALATTDGLTGLKNRRAFQERLGEEARRACRTPCPLSLILLDVDHFKPFNDAFGHPAGDDVLRRVGRLLTETVRSTDVAARYGGEEFAILLPDTDAAGAVVLAERVRRAIEAENWFHRSVTVSVGVATLPDLDGDGQAMVVAADAALYQSKRAGRNCVSHATVPETALNLAG